MPAVRRQRVYYGLGRIALGPSPTFDPTGGSPLNDTSRVAPQIIDIAQPVLVVYTIDETGQ